MMKECELTLFLFFILFLTVVFVGCSTPPKCPDPEIVERVVTIEKPTLLNSPVIKYPKNPKLESFSYDWPRTKNIIIKNTTECLKVEKQKQDTNFWKRCSIYEIDKSSNLYIGFTEDNFKIFLKNWNEITTREKLWRNIIDNENERNNKLNK